MSEEVKLKVSQFVDGELDTRQSLALLDAMRDDPELAALFHRYAAAGQTAKSGTHLTLDESFVASVSAELQSEPTILCPNRHKAPRGNLSALAALAAALAAVAVLAWFNQGRNTSSVPQPPEFAQTYTAPPAYVALNPSQAQDQRFNEYLQAHGATLYLAGQARHPYGQVTSYGQK